MQAGDKYFRAFCWITHTVSSHTAHQDNLLNAVWTWTFNTWTQQKDLPCTKEMTQMHRKTLEARQLRLPLFQNLHNWRLNTFCGGSTHLRSTRCGISDNGTTIGRPQGHHLTKDKKRDSLLKGQTVSDGRSQQALCIKSETSSPTVSTGAIRSQSSSIHSIGETLVQPTK